MRASNVCDESAEPPSRTETSSKCSGRMPAISSPLPAVFSALSAGIRNVPTGSVTWSPSTVAGRKFIGGEPMKPATNRLTGCS